MMIRNFLGKCPGLPTLQSSREHRYRVDAPRFHGQVTTDGFKTLSPEQLASAGDMFDAGEAIGAALSRGIGRLLGRGAEESLAGKKAGQRVTVGLSLLVLAVLLLFELFPFFFAFVSAFKTSNQITDMTSVMWPQPWTLQQFGKLFGETQFGLWYRNTILISVVATAIGVCAAAAGAYALARLRWRGSSSMSSVMLVTYMMPGIVFLIPIYRIMAALGLNNTPYALMIVYRSFSCRLRPGC